MSCEAQINCTKIQHKVGRNAQEHYMLCEKCRNKTMTYQERKKANPEHIVLNTIFRIWKTKEKIKCVKWCKKRKEQGTTKTAVSLIKFYRQITVAGTEHQGGH